MPSDRSSSLLALLFVGLTALPAPAFAQAAIAGSVRDGSGLPVAGVLVETASPALIERVRTTATDGTGRFRIDDLRPGLYSLTFERAGFKTHHLEAVALSGSFTATADVVLQVGDLSESVTVSGALPIVDLQSATREATITGNMIRAIPAARTYNALVALVPGVLTNANDTVITAAATTFPIHGGRTNEGRLLLDGFVIGSPSTGSSATSYAFDVGYAEEIAFTTSGGLGESETAGLVMNIVPKSGGNDRHGSFFGSSTATWLQSDNLTEALRDQGLTGTMPLTKLYDVSGSFGGPVRRNRVWYFVSAHRGSATREVDNVYYNLNAGNGAQWLYAPDATRREYSDRVFENASGRVTWQMTPRNQLTGYLDLQSLCRTCTGATPGLSEPARVSPEAVGVLSRPLTVWQVRWYSPPSDRWLLDAGVSAISFGVGNFERSPNPTRGLVRVAEQCASGCAANGGIPGLVYRSQDFSDAHSASYFVRGSASYITGSHKLQFGYQHAVMIDDRTWFTNDQNLAYRFNNGVPNQLTQSISPWVNDARTAWQALYLQEQWTHRRMTLQGALRFDRAWSWFPTQQEGPSRFLPAAIVIPETRGVDSYKDLSPRIGVVFDVTGEGRTAFKASLGRYLDAAGTAGNYANTNPTLRLPQTTPVFGPAGVTRTWIDANQNFTPDCDLLNSAAQDLRPAGGDLCGVMSNVNFGTNVLTNNFDPRILRGWGVRPSDWALGITLEQQLGRHASVDLTYSRRWFHGFFAVDNLELQPSDLTPFSVTAPLDARLPGGGGYEIPGLYDVVPEKAGRVDNYVTDASRFGNWRQSFSGIDINARVRDVHRLTLMGGTSIGQTRADNCSVRDSLPELSTAVTGTSVFGAGLANSAVTPASPYCRVAYGVLAQVRGLASYVIPKVDLQVSAAFQAKPGPMLAANYAVPNAAVVGSLGRNLSGNAPNVTVNLIEPGSMYGDAIRQLDLRFGKTLRWGGSRTLIAVDIYNVANSSAVLTYNYAFVPQGTWLQPLTILTPRFARVTAEIAF